MKFCFPGENYGKTQTSMPRGQASGIYYSKPFDKSLLKQSSSSFIENETINKGSDNMFRLNDFQTTQGLTSETAQLELFSSGTQVLVRFRSSDGRFPSKGFRAKYKTGKILLRLILLCIMI